MEPYTIAAGVPAGRIADRFSRRDVIECLDRSRWWTLLPGPASGSLLGGALVEALGYAAMFHSSVAKPGLGDAGPKVERGGAAGQDKYTGCGEEDPQVRASGTVCPYRFVSFKL